MLIFADTRRLSIAWRGSAAETGSSRRQQRAYKRFPDYGRLQFIKLFGIRVAVQETGVPINV